MVCLEWPSEDVASESWKGSETGARWIGTANDHVLIVNTPAAHDERIEVYEIIDPILNAAGGQNLE